MAPTTRSNVKPKGKCDKVNKNKDHDESKKKSNTGGVKPHVASSKKSKNAVPSLEGTNICDLHTLTPTVESNIKCKRKRSKLRENKDNKKINTSGDEEQDVSVKKLKIEDKLLEGIRPALSFPSTSKISSVNSFSVAMAVNENEDANSSSDSDWEEVEEMTSGAEEEPVIPKEGVQITLEHPDQRKRRGHKDFDFETFVRRKVLRFKREIQEATHKVHVLCLMAHGIAVRRCLGQTLLRAGLLSLQPVDHLETALLDRGLLQRMIQWYRASFRLGPVIKGDASFSAFQLQQATLSGSANSVPVYVGMFLICVENCGLETRLVISLQPPRRVQPSAKNKLDKAALKTVSSVSSENDVSRKIPLNATTVPHTQRCKKKRLRNEVLLDRGAADEPVPPLERNSKRDIGKRRSSRVVPSYKESSEGESDGEVAKLKRSTRSSHGKKAAKGLPTSVAAMTGEGSEDDDFEIEFEKIKKHGPLRGAKNNRKVLSSESDEESSTDAVGIDYWVEVYLKSERRWICLDCVGGTIDCPQDMEANARKPMSYVFAFDGDGCLKDVTRRYASNWTSHCRKLRASAEWCEETLAPFRCLPSSRDKIENQQLEELLLERPLPKAISEYKNHPLYVLERHLLKFEGIYPPEAVPVGHIRDEAVYSRECVQTLHSRETWMKDARVVERGQVPYKVVKARPKWNRAKGELVTDLPLELFGKWQTIDYVPPPAENGLVPRNEYGNVELFKPSMLPKGTVHLHLPALNRIAKKLGIDCARAMIGWDFHGVGSHPTFDGWIVCEEFSDVLQDAWRQEQIISDKRERERNDKRIYGNWRRLIRGLLIRERLTSRYVNSNQELKSDIAT